tara:strand:+ start:1546 stop:2394 length:849 start_codon:yes stop_codon:yes gene_type:complete
MILEYKDDKENGTFQLTDFTCPDQNQRLSKERLYRVVWVLEGTVNFIVDTVPTKVKKNQLIFFTPHNKVELIPTDHKLIAFAFNREFYCISNHDHEVSCYGYLFYGSSSSPIITLAEKDQKSLQNLFEMLQEEFEYKDHIQGEMLRMLLKRLLINSVRLSRVVLNDITISDSHLDIIRKFNVLVEMHFKEKHQVKDYADLLFKAPKTLSNLFKQYNDKSPLQVINERLSLEAKRQLYHTDKTIDELSYELGYSEAAHFSKFFKKQVGMSPNAFRKGHKNSIH